MIDDFADKMAYLDAASETEVGRYFHFDVWFLSPSLNGDDELERIAANIDRDLADV